MQTHVIGFILKRIREIKGITQQKLAVESDTDTSWLSRIENGHGKVSLEKVEQIARALGVSLYDIMKIYHIQSSGEQIDFSVFCDD